MGTGTVSNVRMCIFKGVFICECLVIIVIRICVLRDHREKDLNPLTTIPALWEDY